MFCMGDNMHENVHQDSTAKKIENYIFNYEDLLGKGNFGAAYRGYDVNTGKQVAIKVIKMASIKSKVFQKLLQNQIQILRNMPTHINLLKCFDVFTSVNNCYIITQLCQSDLQRDLKAKGKFKQYQIKSLVYGIYKGLEELSRNSIIHRDIKLSNVFLTKRKGVKIADFGFAIKATGRFKDLNIGSPLYMSPQGLLSNIYGPKTDVWSFGIMLYQLLHGQTPLQRCTSDQQLKSHILHPPKFLPSISPQLRQLIQACLTIDESKRPNIFQLINFPYMRKLLAEYQGREMGLKESGNQSTECSVASSRYVGGKGWMGGKEVSYEVGLAMLHYCRLLHKANKKVIKSPILSQFLLNLSHSLTKCPISSTQSFNQQRNKLRQVLHQYYNKFVLQHQDTKSPISPKDALAEIQNLKRQLRNNVQAASVLEVLGEETRMLAVALGGQNFEVFQKNSQAKNVIESNRLGI